MSATDIAADYPTEEVVKESDNAETASDRETLLLVAKHLALGSQFLLL